ncbi:MAG: hypothetical protein ACOC8C_01885, partial [Chloroflexota bacterium]
MTLRVRFNRWLLAALGVVALLTLCVKPPPAWAGQDPPASQLVQEAWQKAQDAGQYTFSTEIVQTIYPAAAVVNVGRGPRQQTLHLEGRVYLDERSIEMGLWEGGGSLADPRSGIELRIEGENAFARQAGGPWQEVDDLSSAFAPGSDHLAYLAGAKDVQLLGAETRVLPTSSAHPDSSTEPVVHRFTRYGFDLDGPAFARHLRDQLQSYLRERGELPLGLTLDSSRLYQETTGHGELWVDERGLPLRLIVHLAYPEHADGERIEARIETSFAGFPNSVKVESSLSGRTADWAAGALRLPQTRADRQRTSLRLGLLLASLALVTMTVLNRRSRRVYATVVLLVIISMVVVPFLQSQQIYAFSQDLARQRADQAEREASAEALREEEQMPRSTDWDPHQDPLASVYPSRNISAASSLGEADGSVSGAPAGHGLGLAYDSVGAQAMTATTPQDLASTTGEPDALDTDGDGIPDVIEARLGTDPLNPDTDGDSLSDWIEVYQLGTDPLSQDTDGDGILDQIEVSGFEYGGRRWYPDPNSPDSNGDTLTDGLQCLDLVGVTTVPSPLAQCDNDGDGIPDIFDDDDDGDGVHDHVDLSPNSVIGRNGRQSNADDVQPFDRANPFGFRIDSLASGYPVLVDFQLRPVDPSHLGYAMNVLDWPGGDVEGQIQRVKETTFADSMTNEQVRAYPTSQNGDMRLVPMLELEIGGGAGDYQVPFKLTSPEMSVAVRGEVSGTVLLTPKAGDPDKTTLSFDFGSTSAYADRALIYQGTCPASGAPEVAYGPVADGYHETFDGRLVGLADGEHALVLQRMGKTACATIGNVVNGGYADKMIDPEPLAPYGISVREADDQGTLLAYVPLNVM